MDMLNPKNIKSKSTLYGTKNEKEAKEMYEKLYGVEVIKLGVLVSEKQPWLCGSLDGVVVKDSCICKIVEFKCPSSCEKVAIIDYKNKLSNVKYLQFSEAEVELKKSSAYYTQCQVQMYVSGLCTCDLFIYTPVKNGCCCVEVQRDEAFLQEVIVKSEEFYFNRYLPALQSRLIKNQVQDKTNFTGKDISNQI